MMRRRWLVLGYLVAFALGMVSGAAIVEGRSAAHQAALLNAPPRRSAAFVGLLDRRLKLTPNERQAVESILARHEVARKAAIAPVEPALRDLRNQTRREIREALNTEQGRAFDDLMRELDEARHKR